MSVGTILRQRREELGMNLEDFAHDLRIKLSFLEAIENEDFNDLPGGAYAIGFVKAYAKALGLDPVQAAAAFRKEQAGAMRKAPLTVPTPLAESRVPTTGLLMLVIIVGGLGWATWAWFTNTPHHAVELVTAVPDRLKPEGQEQTAAQQAAVPQPAPPVVNSALSSAASGPQTAPPLGQPTAPVPEPMAPQQQAQPAPQAAAQPPQPAGRGAAIASMPFSQPQADGAEPDEAQNDTDAPEQGPNMRTSPQQAQAATGTVYGDAGGPSRVEIRASGNSWIQVRDPSHTVVYTGILHDGDAYRVPDVQGYTFTTGNAGAVELAKNGLLGQPLGGEGQVMRNVPLDAGSRG